MSILERYANVASADAENALKGEVREIIRAYRHVWDVYGELCQNAVDAINRRFRLCHDPSYYDYDRLRPEVSQVDEPYTRGTIELDIDLASRTVLVRDDGAGMVRDDLDLALLPRQTRKRIAADYGFKGFGLTFVAFVSRSFRITSRSFTGGSAFTYQMDGAFDWASDNSGSVRLPQAPDAPFAANLPPKWSTEVEVRLEDDYENRFPASAALDRMLALCTRREDVERLEYVLRSRTALGNTRPMFSLPPVVPIDIKLSVRFPEASEVDSKTIPYCYWHPSEHAELKVSHYEFPDYVQKSSTRVF